MGKRSVSRRQFLNAAGMGGSIAFAAGQLSLPAAASEQAPDAGASRVEALGRYTGTPFAADEAAHIASMLDGPISAVRGIKPPNYLDIAPASIFRVPADT